MKEADISKGSVTVVVLDADTALVAYSDSHDISHCESINIGCESICVTGTGSGSCILIDGNHVKEHCRIKILLHKVDITPSVTDDGEWFSAVSLKNSSNVIINYCGPNNLVGGKSNYGINVPKGCQLIIERPVSTRGTLTSSSLGLLGGIGSHYGTGRVIIKHSGEL